VQESAGEESAVVSGKEGKRKGTRTSRSTKGGLGAAEGGEWYPQSGCHAGNDSSLNIAQRHGRRSLGPIGKGIKLGVFSSYSTAFIFLGGRGEGSTSCRGGRNITVDRGSNQGGTGP